MLDIEVSPEVADAIAEIGRVDPRYHSPEGVLFRKTLELVRKYWVPYGICEEDKMCVIGGISMAAKHTGIPVTATWLDDHETTRLCNIIHNHVNMDVAIWSDSHTHGEVVAMLTNVGHANGWL